MIFHFKFLSKYQEIGIIPEPENISKYDLIILLNTIPKTYNCLKLRYTKLKNFQIDPKGFFSEGKWFPGEEEECPIYKNIISSGFKNEYKLLDHCRTFTHVLFKWYKDKTNQLNLIQAFKEKISLIYPKKIKTNFEKDLIRIIIPRIPLNSNKSDNFFIIL